MCPSASIAPAIELDHYSTDEAICAFLMQLKGGRSLPMYVLPDVDLYEILPSNLPADMWYYWCGTKKDAENRWRSTGEACEVYSTSNMIGWRKTFQFYEAKSPNGEKTNWMMQEYTITDKYSSKPDKRGLCRVFLVDGNNSGQLSKSKSELMEKNVGDVAEASTMANQSPEPPIGDYLELGDLDIPLFPMANRSFEVAREDYLELNDLDTPPAMAKPSPEVALGDYLELNDLDIPLSRSTSSADSSCMIMSSGELFDLDALIAERGIQDPTVNFSRSAPAPAKLERVLVPPTTSGTRDNGEESKPLKGKVSQTGAVPHNEAGNDKEGTSKTRASSSSSEGSSKEEKRGRIKKRKVIKYLCFFAF